MRVRKLFNSLARGVPQGRLAVSFNVNSKITTLKIAENLRRHTNNYSRSIERLSSGVRINSAKDDPGGSALADVLRVNRKVAAQGKRNVNDGISVANIAQDSYQEIGNLLMRMAELAEQAASGVLRIDQRKALDEEFAALDKEISRIARSTQYNGRRIIDGVANNGDSLQVTDLTNNIAAFDLSLDGRYATYVNPDTGELQQHHLQTGVTTTLSTGLSTPLALRASANGNVIVFENNANLTGENSQGADQLFRYDRATGELTQITNTQTGNVISSFELSEDGSTLVFNSTADYTDGGTKSDVAVGASQAINTINLETGIFSRVAQTTVGVVYDGLAISHNGEYVAFGTNGDFTLPTPVATAVLEVFTKRVGADFEDIEQVTDGNVFVLYQENYVSNDGDVFVITTQNLTGDNGSNYEQLYKYESTSSTLEQLTANSNGSLFVGQSLAADGETFSILASTSLLDPDTTDAFSATQTYNTRTGEIEITSEIRNPQLSLFTYLVSGDSFSVIGNSNADPLGHNPDGNLELFYGDFRREQYQLNIQAGSGTTNARQILIGDVRSSVVGTNASALTSIESAQGALEHVKESIGNVSLTQSALEAGLGQLKVAQALLSSEEGTLEAAEQRIRDLDVAEETTNALKSKILQDAGVALHAQANADAQIAGQLLDAAGSATQLANDILGNRGSALAAQANINPQAVQQLIASDLAQQQILTSIKSVA